MRLEGKKLVVTGATGIAAASARRFAEQGGQVFVIARSPDQCDELTRSIHEFGGSCDFAIADLTDEVATTDAFKRAHTVLGRIDGLMQVAGGSGRRHGDGPIHDVPFDGWSETLSLNGDPAFLATREAIRAMLMQREAGSDGGGSVVLVSSVLATSPVPSLFATHSYASVKGATNALGRSLAAYYAHDSIRVNVIAPGLVATPMSERAAADPDTVDYATRKQPLAAGFLEADDVADTAVFLLSDESSQVTGQLIAVDGGWSVTEA